MTELSEAKQTNALSPWIFFNCKSDQDTHHGFKIHVNAVSEDFEELSILLDKLLTPSRSTYKRLKNKEDCAKLNEGSFGLHQVGKAFTIYPEGNDAFVALISRLTEELERFSGPCPPTDLRVKNSQILSYRWASPGEGQSRSAARPVPAPVFDPICGVSPLGDPFQLYRENNFEVEYIFPIRNSGKGAVFQVAARNQGTGTVDMHIVKEFRGLNRAKHFDSELAVLTRVKGQYLPKIIFSGSSGESNYLITRWEHGYHTLSEQIKVPGVIDAPSILSKISSAALELHSIGYQWWDVSPENILVNEEMDIILLDFENSSQLTPVNCYLTDDFKPTSSLMDYGEYLVQSLDLLTAWIERQLREEH